MSALYIGPTPYGQGVFAAAAIRKGEHIIFFGGAVIRAIDMPKPYDALDDHYVQVGKELYMGPSGKEDDFINHSCDPNSGLVVEGSDVALVAIRDIECGEEITWDYSTTMDEDEFTMECRCGSERCRGVIRDFKFLPEATKKRYLELGIVPEYVREK